MCYAFHSLSAITINFILTLFSNVNGTFAPLTYAPRTEYVYKYMHICRLVALANIITAIIFYYCYCYY